MQQNAQAESPLLKWRSSLKKLDGSLQIFHLKANPDIWLVFIFLQVLQIAQLQAYSSDFCNW